MSIEASHVSKSFGSFAALRDVSLRVNTGELVALLGPSGSGKTTLLRIIAGLECADPGTGTVRFGDQDVTSADVGRRGVGFVFQHYALFRNMTVFKNVAFGLQVRPRAHRPTRRQIRDRVMELLRLVQLEGLADRYPSQLSGGQRQRVALARALAVEPKVLLLDEPFGALDAKVRRELRKWLRDLHDKVHVTSVFVTHDQEEALEVADRVVVMNKGRIEQDGTPAEVFHRPVNAFVMDFLGNVNLFHGRIEGGRAVFGSLVVDHPQPTHADGAAKLFVRPHDLDVRRDRDGVDGTPGLPAKVARVQSAGATVKLELVGGDGQTFFADLPHERFRDLDVGPDADVFVAVRQARVFTDDYSI